MCFVRVLNSQITHLVPRATLTTSRTVYLRLSRNSFSSVDFLMFLLLLLLFFFTSRPSNKNYPFLIKPCNSCTGQEVRSFKEVSSVIKTEKNYTRYDCSCAHCFVFFIVNDLTTFPLKGEKLVRTSHSYTSPKRERVRVRVNRLTPDRWQSWHGWNPPRYIHRTVQLATGSDQILQTWYMIKLLRGKESKLLQCSGNCPKTSNDRGEQLSFCAIYFFQKALAMIEGSRSCLPASFITFTDFSHEGGR